LAGNQDLVGDPEFRQVSDHYSLSAVISIPSWWNEIEVKIDKCWLKTSEFSASDSSLCKNDSSSPPSPSFTIRVPGNTDDIHQKLGFEVLKTPYLSSTTQQQIFEVGREAKVLLEGVRLWRSTVVMLDNQKADSIEVLPDMDAVLAKFTCLNSAASSGEIMETYLYDYSDSPGISENSLLVKFKKKQADKLVEFKKQQAAGQLPPEMMFNPDNPDDYLPIVGCTQMSDPQDPGSNIKNGCIAYVRLWTSEGNTSNNPLQVVLKPFVQRYVGEAPC
jgi:hypothetical protein